MNSSESYHWLVVYVLRKRNIRDQWKVTYCSYPLPLTYSPSREKLDFCRVEIFSLEWPRRSSKNSSSTRSNSSRSSSNSNTSNTQSPSGWTTTPSHLLQRSALIRYLRGSPPACSRYQMTNSYGTLAPLLSIWLVPSRSMAWPTLSRPQAVPRSPKRSHESSQTAQRTTSRHHREGQRRASRTPRRVLHSTAMPHPTAAPPRPAAPAAPLFSANEVLVLVAPASRHLCRRRRPPVPPS